MTGPIGNGTADDAIRVALNGLAKRQKAISNNVANVDTPGFKATEVRFEDELRRAISRATSRSTGEGFITTLAPVSHRPGHLAIDVTNPADVQPQLVRDPSLTTRVDGNTVDIEKQMIDMADTAISYNALIQLATARISMTRYAVNEGRR